MALITCPKCGASVSDKAVACPNCGHPINETYQQSAPPVQQPAQTQPVNGRSKLYLWMVIAVIILIFGLFALLGTCHWKVV